MNACSGNYKGYYTKRRFNQDPYAGDDRLALIPKEWMEDKRVLDVGCNVGKVTIEIGEECLAPLLVLRLSPPKHPRSPELRSVSRHRRRH